MSTQGEIPGHGQHTVHLVFRKSCDVVEQIFDPRQIGHAERHVEVRVAVVWIGDRCMCHMNHDCDETVLLDLKFRALCDLPICASLPVFVVIEQFVRISDAIVAPSAKSMTTREDASMHTRLVLGHPDVARCTKTRHERGV